MLPPQPDPEPAWGLVLQPRDRPPRSLRPHRSALRAGPRGPAPSLALARRPGPRLLPLLANLSHQVLGSLGRLRPDLLDAIRDVHANSQRCLDDERERCPRALPITSPATSHAPPGITASSSSSNMAVPPGHDHAACWLPLCRQAERSPWARILAQRPPPWPHQGPSPPVGGGSPGGSRARPPASGRRCEAPPVMALPWVSLHPGLANR